MENAVIAAHFKLLGEIMELYDENSFKIKSYTQAARTLKSLDTPLAALSLEEIKEIPGVGDAIATKISQLITTGHLELLEKYLAKTPPGVVQMLGIKGIGPKKIAQLWKELGVESLGELYYACLENRLVTLKGFGEKTQENLLKHIEFLLANDKKHLYARAERYVIQQITLWQSIFPEAKWQPCGALRDKEIVLETPEILVSGVNINTLMSHLQTDEKTVLMQSNGSILIKDSVGIDILLTIVPENAIGTELFIRSGTENFRNKLLEAPKIPVEATEAAIFEAAGWPFVPPECRNDFFSDKNIAAILLDGLITEKDIKGVVHTHTVYSDGSNTIAQMAQQCIVLGYEYLVISDHSKSAFYANGLQESRVLHQHEEIDAFNAKSNFTIFKSIESDILNDGSLDYHNDFLQHFDLVIASVHSQLRMDENKAMQRIIKAIEHPATNILGHPSGRLLLSREGYPLDYKKLIDACAANGVHIELNANPHRLDIDWTWLPYCMEKEVMISINPDAHNLKGIGDIRYGVMAARKGGLQKNACLNALSKDAFKLKLQKNK